MSQLERLLFLFFESVISVSEAESGTKTADAVKTPSLSMHGKLSPWRLNNFQLQVGAFAVQTKCMPVFLTKKTCLRWLCFRNCRSLLIFKHSNYMYSTFTQNCAKT